MTQVTAQINEVGKWLVVLALIVVGGNSLSWYANERTIDRRLQLATVEFKRELAADEREDDRRHREGLADRVSIKAMTAADHDFITRNGSRLDRIEARLAALEKRLNTGKSPVGGTTPMKTGETACRMDGTQALAIHSIAARKP